MTKKQKPLAGRVALVAGATRGAGRAIAIALGEAGAIVYCSGRSSREKPRKRPETVDETAELVTRAGGEGVAVRCDHSVSAEVQALSERVARERGGLDVLINDIWGCDDLLHFGGALWEGDPEHARTMFDRAVITHIITSRWMVPLLLPRPRGLVVEVTDGDTFGYRGMAVYDAVKMTNIRLAFNLHKDLTTRGHHHVTSLAVTPGFLRSEEMLERFGVTEANWRDGAKVTPDFIASESPAYVGRAVAALAADDDVHTKAGRVFSSWGLQKEYGFKDADGATPDWGAHFAKTYGRAYVVADEAAYASWSPGPADLVKL